MTVPRIHVPGVTEEGKFCELGGRDLRYVRSVLRMKTGDRLILFDGAGCECEAVIRTVSSEGVKVEVLKKNMIDDQNIRITMYQALPKGNKMDAIVRKATELGAGVIIPFTSARSVPRLTQEKARDRVSRWRNIAKEAARQSGRADIPEVEEILSFDEMLASSEGQALKIIFWEEELERGVKELLRGERNIAAKNISAIIGPEGGFSKEEVARAAVAGFISVSLGRYVLKVETAAVTILSIIQYELGIFGGERRREGGSG
ncbi:MAG TPA: 16S rRNA (uracil(1498)-N(3))-methyltransferase [Syntrophales bacterium]|nr:16S rRNA (uracil(1498)-N(3))-methyltransferase [Syntrophales bacterium]